MDKSGTFTKVHHNQDSIVDLLATRTLEPRDVAILFCLAEMMNPANGKVLSTTSGLARKINMRQPLVAHAIRRLKAARIVVNKKDRDGGYWYFRLNPRFVSVGNERQRSMHWKDFASALQEEYPRGAPKPADANDPTAELFLWEVEAALTAP